MEEGHCWLFFPISEAILLCFFLLKYAEITEGGRHKKSIYNQTQLKEIQRESEVWW